MATLPARQLPCIIVLSIHTSQPRLFWSSGNSVDLPWLRHALQLSKEVSNVKLPCWVKAYRNNNSPAVLAAQRLQGRSKIPVSCSEAHEFGSLVLEAHGESHRSGGRVE